jgi:hypothetical protein
MSAEEIPVSAYASRLLNRVEVAEELNLSGVRKVSLQKLAR